MRVVAATALLVLCGSAYGADTEDNFTEKQDEAIVTVAAVFSVFSFIGSSFIVFMYLRHPKLRSLMFRLVVWISVSDIIASLGFLFGNPSDGTSACYAQAVLQQLFQIASMLWTVVVARVVQMVWSKARTLEQIEGDYWKMHAVVWGGTVLLAIPAAASENYGETAGWCWISVRRREELGTAWRFLCFYIPLWFIAAYNLTVFWVVRSQVKQISANGSTALPRSVQTLARMVWYPVVLVICYIFGTINRIQNIFGPPSYEIVILHALFQSSQGIGNAIVYGTTPSVREALREMVYGPNTANQNMVEEEESNIENSALDRVELSLSETKH